MMRRTAAFMTTSRIPPAKKQISVKHIREDNANLHTKWECIPDSSSSAHILWPFP